MTNAIRIYPSANSTPDVIAALESAAENTSLIFEDADYHFYSEGARVSYFAPTNNMSGEKRVVFPLLGLKNIRISGNGARFIFHSRLFPFITQRCEDAVIEDISIDFAFPRYAVGEVVSCDYEGFALRVDGEKYPYIVENGHLAFNAGDEWRTTAEKKFFLSGLPGEPCGVSYLVAGETKDPLTNLPAQVMRTDADESGGIITLRYRPGSPRMDYAIGQKLLISHDENRENDVFFIEDSTDVTLRSVNIFRGAGMGIIGQTSCNITVENMVIAVPEWRDEPVSITADAFHFVHCTGKLTVRNCRVTDTLDDAANIHGIYTLAEEVMGDRAKVRLGHHEQYGFNPYRPGDMLRFIGEHGEKGCAAVTESVISENGESILLTFDRAVSSMMFSGDHIENPDRMPEILMENNSFLRCPNVLLGSGKPTVVRNNEFALGGAMTIVDNMKYWYESGPANDLLIENNTFRTANAAITAVLHGAEETGRRHRNIRILNNRVYGGALLEAAYVDGLHIIGEGRISLHNCENIATGETEK